MSDNSFPFMRMGDPFILSVSPTPSQYDLPDGFFEPSGLGSGAQSFLFINPNLFWVRFVGSVNTFVPSSETKGFLFPPGFWGILTTRFSGDGNPKHLSVMSVAYQGIAAGTGACEVNYGGGA